MDTIDSTILKHLKEYEKLAELRHNFQLKLQQYHDTNILQDNISKIKKEKDEYVLYKSLEKDIKNGRHPAMACQDHDTWRQMNEQYQKMELIYHSRNNSKCNTGKCNTDFQLLLSQTIIQLYELIENKSIA